MYVRAAAYNLDCHGGAMVNRKLSVSVADIIRSL